MPAEFPGITIGFMQLFSGVLIAWMKTCIVISSGIVVHHSCCSSCFVAAKQTARFTLFFTT